MELLQLARIVSPLGIARGLHRISGGSETDVYQSDDGSYVYKVKPLVATSLDAANAELQTMQQAAMRFAAYLGADHSIPTEFFLSEDAAGRLYAVGVQKYIGDARPLANVAYATLPPQQRVHVEWQLLRLLRQALLCYHETGQMPDLYGTFSRTIRERQRMNSPLMWPRRVWQFFTQRLWSAHNLLLTNEVAPRVVLVDYDRVRWRGWWGQLYYAICYLLFWRDLLALGRIVTLPEGKSQYAPSHR